MNSLKRQLAMTIAAEEEEWTSDYENELLSLMVDDDDNLLEMMMKMAPPPKKRKKCINNYIEEVVVTYTDEEFVTHFRVKRELFAALCKRFNEFYDELCPDNCLSATKHILVFLWFAGHEACSFSDISDRFDISVLTVNQIITRVTMFLSELADEAFKWPTSAKAEQISLVFEHKCGIPKIIGAIDTTHITIDPPRNGKDDYINQQGLTSICLQIICDHNRKFTDIFVGYPGSVDDSTVFKNSFIFPKLERLCKDYCILGDSAYPLQKNLLTPYRDNGHLSASQKYYNRQLSSSRVIIEHAFGILKQRFRQLYHCKLRGMKELCHFVRACCILHNLANETDLNFEDSKERVYPIVPEPHVKQEGSNSTSVVAKEIRDSICAELWKNKK